MFAGGRPIKKVPQEYLVDELFAQINAWVASRGGTSS